MVNFKIDLFRVPVQFWDQHYYLKKKQVILNLFPGNPQHTLSFGYDVSDPATGNNQYRSEERHPNGTVVGRYGYVDPYGRPMKYKYIADKFGYRYVIYFFMVTLNTALMDEVASCHKDWPRTALDRAQAYINKIKIFGTYTLGTNFKWHATFVNVFQCPVFVPR